MIKVTSRGSFSNSLKYLDKLQSKDYLNILDKYGELGIEALRHATPKDTGKTSESWYYEIVEGTEQSKIVWYNSNVNEHVNIALILQYGHATSSGTYVEGIDYINPAIKPTFDKLAVAVWSEVKNL
jgi:hypothetical protein